MLTYETLDSIADAVNPSLLVCTLLWPILPKARRSMNVASWYVAIIVGLAIVYSLHFADRALDLWKSAGSDYSTHTAFAIALAAVWSRTLVAGFVAVAMVVLAYCFLMLYQRYHTLVDIGSTAVLVGTIVGLIATFLRIPREQETVA